MPSAPPTVNYFANPVAQFILSEERRYRVMRHAVLVSVIAFQFLAPYLEERVSVDTVWALLINVGMLFVMLALIYTNLYKLVPWLLWPGRFVAYLVALLALVTLFWLFLWSCARLAPENLMADKAPNTFSVVNFIDTILLPLIFVGATTGLQIFKRWVADTRRMNELETRNLREELNQLKSQINPHFLFNTLNNLEVLTRVDPDRASHFLFSLSDILRYQLYESNRDTVLLSRDITNIRQWLALETIRRDDFEVCITVDETIDHQTVAPFLFTPFVENALKHSATPGGPSYVRLAFSIDANRLVFRAENSKPHRAVAEAGGIGLKNIRRRLALLYPDRHTLTLTDAPTQFTVNLTIAV